MKNDAWLNKNSGMTLVELLVAMVVGLILLGGVYVSFVSSTTTNSMNEQLSRLQENGRFAMGYLARELRMAGYIGCSTNITPDSILTTQPPVLDVSIPVRGWDADNTSPEDVDYDLVNDVSVVTTSSGGWSASGIDAATVPSLNAVPGTDIVQIWGVNPDDSIPVISITPGANTIVQIGNAANSGIAKDDILLLSDCTRSTWIGACQANYGIAGNPNVANLVLNASCGNTPGHNYLTQTGGEILRFRSLIFYIGKRGNVAENPSSLFVVQSGLGGLSTPLEIVEGVESMQILYGEDTSSPLDGFVNSYVSASEVLDWNNVYSLRFNLLMASTNELLRGEVDNRPYRLANMDFIAPSDRKLRQVFTSTIALRNKIQ